MKLTPAQHFKREVLARDGWTCLRRGRAGHTCSGQQLDAHHLIREQTLRRAVPGHEFDPRIGMTVCRGLHAALHGPWEQLKRSEIPERAWEFAAEHGIEHELERSFQRRVNTDAYSGRSA